MGIGSKREIMAVRADRILSDWAETATIIRSGGNMPVSLYIDRPQADRDMAPHAHEFDVILRDGQPAGVPLQPGELVRDANGVHYIVRVLRQEPPLALGQFWRCNALATVYRSAGVKDARTGVTTHASAPAASDLHCRISMHPNTAAVQQEGKPLQVEARWVTQEDYIITFPSGTVQAGDEIEAPGFPRLKAGRPTMGDAADVAWELAASLAVPLGVPGREV